MTPEYSDLQGTLFGWVKQENSDVTDKNYKCESVFKTLVVWINIYMCVCVIVLERP